MSKDLKNRVTRVEAKLSPPKYLTYEDLLRRVHLKREKALSSEERQTLEELEKLPLAPTLEESFKRIVSKRQRNDRI